MSRSRYFYADSEGVRKAERMLAHIDGGAKKALSNALNRSIENSRAETVRAVRERYTVRADAVRKTLKLSKAKPTFLRASVNSTGSRLDMAAFRLMPGTPNGKRRTPIRVGILKRSSEEMGRAFIARTQRGIGVYARVGDSRNPIHRKYSLSVPQMLDHDNVSNQIIDKAEQTFHVRLDHEIDRILKGIGK